AFLVFAPGAIVSGAKQMKENAIITSSVQLAECAAAVTAMALALGGIKIWGVDIPACFLMSLCFFYSKKDNTPLAMLAVISAVFMQWQNENFAFIFAGFLLIGFAALSFMQKGYAGYFGVFAVSLGITLAFMTQFNSFIFAVTASIALTVCFIMSKCCTATTKTVTAETAGEQDYLALMGNIDRLGRAFRFLGSTVADISNLIAKDDVAEEVHSVAAREVCRKCRSNHICWQQFYDHTQQQFSACEYALRQGRDFAFDQLFLSRCDKAQQLMQSFASAHRLSSTRKIINQAGRHQQQILQNQFFTMAQTLQDIVHHSSRSGVANTAFTHTINSLLLSMGKKVNYCLCFQDTDRCIISTNDYFSPAETERIRTKLESIYGKRFSAPAREKDTNGVLYTFCQVPRYTLEMSCKCKSRYNVCGDICEEIVAERYRYVILTDGMGTGSFAAAESRTAVEMLKSLLTAGITAKTAVDIANIALNLKGTGQSCVALDILQFDVYNGEAVIYKAGAAASLLINAGKSKKIYKESLPVGILKDIKIEQEEFTVHNGDTIVMMSDGVSVIRTDLQKISLMAEKCTPQQMAEYIISQQSDVDDATAAVIKITGI
ncbi:MAG: SpoIIE family protein phosphatase, partial [Oscillospiraceae bacterium]|nr:SpoIIE family protein phosphatase [Oscillospiraceae bacterium]